MKKLITLLLIFTSVSSFSQGLFMSHNKNMDIGDLRLLSTTTPVRIGDLDDYVTTATIGLFETGTSTPLSFDRVVSPVIKITNFKGGGSGDTAQFTNNTTIGQATATINVFGAYVISSSFIIDFELLPELMYDISTSPILQETVPAK